MKYTLLLLFLPFFSVAQLHENSKLPPVMPVNPKAAEFLKFIDVPVSKYTGVPSITIPLFDLEAGGLDFPISLDYHANGFRVDEESGCTGLGWAMSANWSIVQAVNGLDDFGIYRNRLLPDFAAVIDAQCEGTCPAPGVDVVNNCAPFILSLDGGPYAPGYTGNEYTFGMEHAYIEDFVLGLKDYQPDIFIFSMPGFSGKFLLDWKNNNYVCISDSKVKVRAGGQIQDGVPQDFTILVPDGHLFIFTLKEETIINYNISQKQAAESGPAFLTPNLMGKVQSRTYQLSKILTNKGDALGITYIQTAPIKNFPNISQTDTQYQADYGFNFPNDMSGVVTNYSYTQQPFSYIDEITFNNGLLKFSYSDRLDIVGAKKLDYVELKNKTNSASVKRFNFTYDYFIGHSLGTNTDSEITGNFLVNKTTQELTHRLRLLSVKEEWKRPYYFDYESQQLPKKTSLAVDYWGMYNGFLTNNSRFVDVYKFNEARDQIGYRGHMQNVNCSNFTYLKAAVLNKITYPTGGSAKMEYEINSFNNVSVPTDQQGLLKNVVLSTVADPYPKLQEAVIVEGGNVMFRVSGLLSTQGCSPQYPYAYSNCFFKIVHFKKELIAHIKNNPVMNANLNNYGIKYVLGANLDFLDGSPSNQALYDQFFKGDYYIRKTLGVVTDELISEKLFNLEEGIFVFTVSGGCGTYDPTGSGNSSQSSFNVFFNDYKPLTAPLSYGAGIRIKSITNYSSSNVIASKRLYSYEGGKLMSNLKYFNRVRIPSYRWQDEYNFLGCMGYKFVLNSNSYISPSATAGGKYVGYDRVDETNQNFASQLPATNGRITEYYTNYPDNGSGTDWYLELGMPVVQSYEDNGLLKKQEFYDITNTKVKEINNIYSLRTFTCSHGMKQTFKSSHYYSYAQHFGVYKNYHIGVYAIKGTNTILASSTELSFSASGVMTVNKEYGYNDFNQMVYSKTKLANSTESTETYFTYPKDLPANSPNAVGLQMANKNILSPILGKTIKKNGEIVSREEFDYQYSTNANNNAYLLDIFQMKKVRYAKGALPLEEIFSYDIYDSKGNILQTSKDGFYTSYIWGYNKKYPVAKIENLKYSDIPTGVLNSVPVYSLYDSAGYSEANLRSTMANLRTALPQASVHSYTIVPLVGVSSITSPSGETIFYDYDFNGRLFRIKDLNLHITSQIEYNLRP